MSDRFVELRTILADVRARWTRRALLRAWTLGAFSAAAMLLVGLFAIWLIAGEGAPLVIAVVAVIAVAIVALVCALLPFRQAPSDRQIARFIEEQSGHLDDVLVTAVEKGSTGTSPMTEVLLGDALRTARSLSLDTIIGRDTVKRAVAGAAVASLALSVTAVFFAPSAGRAADVVGASLFPKRYTITVTPGSVKVRAGQPLTVTASIPGIDGGLVPDITVGNGEAARSARLAPGAAAGEFTITLNNIETSFPYQVTLGSVQSAQFQVDVIRPVRVSRVDVRYEYPQGVGLPSQTEQDTGDIYAPAGTTAHLTITTDKPVKQGQLTLSDGTTISLTGNDTALSAALTVSKDGSYRIALNDIDDLTSEGTEYFIRMLNDRPPDVRILRPAGDKHVSPLEEVAIEARADDDYGVQSLELVFKTSAGKETVVPLGQPISGSVATGAHTVYLEDLRVTPGDFVTYYARARDVGRGRRATEARSDIFFLEVKPYEEEFTASESQAAGGMQGEQTGLEELIAQQKDVIAATWKLDARARRARDARSQGDIKAVAVAQTLIKGKVEEMAGEMAAAAFAQRRRRTAQPGLSRAGTEDPIAQAVTAMGQAVTELDRLGTTKALPFEEAALGHLLKAQAEIRRRQVAMQQAQGGGGNGNRQTLDLSTLFEQELRKRQQTNYETPSTSEARGEETKKEDDPLAGIRELARRQEALARQQRELAKSQAGLTPEEIKRQLERLTRDQNELRKQAEELSQQLQKQAQAANQSGESRQQQQQGGQGQQGQSRGGSQGQGGQGGQGSSAEQQKLREVSEEMRNAEGDLRRQDPQQASARGDRASQQLRSLEQQMQGSRPDERRRAIGDLQMEARQIAEAERRLGNEASRAGSGNTGEDARRRLAAEQERLADRTDRLGDTVRQLSRSTARAEGEDGQAMTEASRELDRQKIGERMRQTAQGMRQPAAGGQGNANKPDDLARALDQVAERLGSATGAQDSETAQLSEQLARTQELRDRLSELQRTMDALAREQGQQSGGQQAGQKPGSQSGQAQSSSSSGQPGANGAQGNGEGGRAESVARLQRDADNQMREAQKLAEGVQRENPQMSRGTTPEQWSRSVSAPGTEAFKQDFANWESLKKNLLVALERTESQLSEQLRTRESRERLNAGRHDAVAETYRQLVDRYYQSLATPRKPTR